MATIHISSCPVCNHSDWEQHLKVKDHSISKEAFSLEKCRNCSFVITQDQPDQNSIGPYYASENYISHSDIQKGLVNRLYHGIRTYMLDKKRTWVEENISDTTGKKLLDIGCGTGYFLSNMVENGWNGRGLEPDVNARKAAKEKFKLKVDDASKLFEIQEQFDAITMWHVLEHVHQLNDYFEQFKKLLKPNGLLLIAVPNYTSKDAQQYKDYWAAYDVPRHLWHFSPASMKILMDKHGFTITKKYGMVFDPFYVAMLSEKYKGRGFSMFRGGLSGILSNIRASKNVDKSSSVVYIAKKTK